jgi:hypothetical protein
MCNEVTAIHTARIWPASAMQAQHDQAPQVDGVRGNV